jgi:hypothetical protein
MNSLYIASLEANSSKLVSSLALNGGKILSFSA